MAEVLGLEIAELPAGWVPLEAYVMVRCLTEDGEVAMCSRTTPGLMEYDTLGMLEAGRLVAQRHVMRIYESDNGDDD